MALRELLIALDVETTGLDRFADEIIELALWRMLPGEAPQLLHFFVRPNQEVPQKILRLTGIGKDELEGARTLLEHKEEVLQALQGAIIVGHNISFDIHMLERGLGVRLGNEVWDTLDLARVFFPSLKTYRLGALAEKLGLELSGNLHQATHDALLAYKVLEACWEKGLQFDLSFFHHAQYYLPGWPSRGFFTALQREVTRRFPTRPIRTDVVLAPAQGLFRETTGAGEMKKKVPQDASWVAEALSPGGELARNLSGYESRQGQVAMATAVAKALVRSEHLVVEAGTGTGKSLAYLVPCLWWAQKTGQRVVVAIHTIPLQEQLAQKDLPILSTALSFPFKSMILKGKGNYICLRNWLTHVSEGRDLVLEEKLASLSLLTWLRETQTGDLQELPQTAGIVRLWPKFNSEGCISSRCPQAGTCFLLRAKQKAEEADVLIVNHSLLFSDIKTDYNVLPEYHYVVVDEAHHFYSTALEQLGLELSEERIAKAIERIFRPSGPSLVNHLKARSAYYHSLAPNVWERFKVRLDDVPAGCALVLEQAQSLFQLLQGVIGERLSLRLVKAHKNMAWWGTLEIQTENLGGRIKALYGILENLVNLLDQEEADEFETVRRELGEGLSELENLMASVPGLNLEDPGVVIWLERSPSLTWKRSPVDVSSALEKVFAKLEAAILTSATLSVAGSFAHLLEELGLPQDTRTLQVDSPFDYEEQMQFYVVKGLMDPKGEELRVAEDVAEFIAEVSERLGGRTLVLFTSHRFLQATYYPLKQRLEGTNIDTLGQGIDGARSAILDDFKRKAQSVLLGASSFWEGIDIMGEALSCVVLVKLPFWAPTVPLIEARAEFMQSQGRDPFRELFLPDAIIRFKQGFGRLIRSQGDRGVVILLDSRIAEKSYGRVFLSSLPLRTHIRGDRGQILRRLEAWLEG